MLFLWITIVMSNLFKRQLLQVELTQQSPSQCASNSHDNPKHRWRQSTFLVPGVTQHLNSQFWPALHSFVLTGEITNDKTISNLNTITSHVYATINLNWLHVIQTSNNYPWRIERLLQIKVLSRHHRSCSKAL